MKKPQKNLRNKCVCSKVFVQSIIVKILVLSTKLAPALNSYSQTNSLSTSFRALGLSRSAIAINFLQHSLVFWQLQSHPLHYRKKTATMTPKLVIHLKIHLSQESSSFWAISCSWTCVEVWASLMLFKCLELFEFAHKVSSNLLICKLDLQVLNVDHGSIYIYIYI